MDWDGELIALMREFGGTRLARHAHLPLQSGSDAVLRRMHRRYRPWHYADKVEALLRAAGPDLTLGADVMVGFPGETDREFEETLAFIRALPFGYLHLFPFSPRPRNARLGTPRRSRPSPRPLSKSAWPRSALSPPKRRAPTAAASSAASSRHHAAHPGRRSPPQGRTAALTENFLPVELDGTFARKPTLARAPWPCLDGVLKEDKAGQSPAAFNSRSQSV